MLHADLERMARARAGRPALLFRDEVVTFGQLWDAVGRVANLLTGRFGLDVGDRFALVAKNRPEYAELFFGAAASGTTCVPLNYRLAVAEQLRILAESGTRVLFVDDEHAGRADELTAAGYDGIVVHLDGRHGDLPTYRDLLADASARSTPPHVDARTPVLDMYTSGTTGTPKAVMLSHRNFAANRAASAAEDLIRDGDTVLGVSPLCHLTAGSRIFALLTSGAAYRVEPTFDPDRVLHHLGSGEVTVSVLVPTMLRELAGRTTDAARLRLLIYGTEPMSPELARSVSETLGCPLAQGYGLTETTGLVTLLGPDDHRRAIAGEAPELLRSVGRAAKGVGVRVSAAAGDIGEVHVRGEIVTEGYRGRPDLTAERLVDGWLATGDLGHLDADGYLYLVARRNDMIVTGGLNVYPGEIERAIETHPGVRRCVVVGVPDERWGETPVALVQPRPDAAEDVIRDGLRSHLDGLLARYKHPHRVVFRPALPTTITGKLDRRAARQLVDSLTTGATSHTVTLDFEGGADANP